MGEIADIIVDWLLALAEERNYAVRHWERDHVMPSVVIMQPRPAIGDGEWGVVIKEQIAIYWNQYGRSHTAGRPEKFLGDTTKRVYIDLGDPNLFETLSDILVPEIWYHLPVLRCN